MQLRSHFDHGCASQESPLQSIACGADLYDGEPYILIGRSALSYVTEPDSPTRSPQSVRHGVVASSLLDRVTHVRGDGHCTPGDSGGGCFSAKRRRLLAMNVGMLET